MPLMRRWFNRKLRPIRRRPSLSRLILEPLEDRSVPANIMWIASGSGMWDQGSNWQGGVAPGVNDVAIIDTPNITVTIQTGDSIQAQGVTMLGNDTLSFTGGSLTTSGTSSVGNVSLTNDGTLTSNGVLTV